MENLSLSVPDLLAAVKQFVPEADKREQLDQMLQRYMQKTLDKKQACRSVCPVRLRALPGPSPAAVARVHRIDPPPLQPATALAWYMYGCMYTP